MVCMLAARLWVAALLLGLGCLTLTGNMPMARSDRQAARTSEHLREAWHRPAVQGWSAQGANSLFDSGGKARYLGLT